MFETVNLIYSILITGILFPGPSFLFIVLNSLSQNKVSSILTAAGMSFCNFCIAFGVISVLSRVTSLDVLWIKIIQLTGALYLIIISLIGLSKHLKLSPKNEIKTEVIKKLDIKKSLFYGFMFQFCNPKVWFFFLSSFSTITLPSNHVKIFHIVVLVTITSFIWYSSVAFLVSTTRLYKVFRTFILSSSAIMLLLSIVFILNLISTMFRE